MTTWVPESQHGTRQKIADWWQSKTDQPRYHLGASAIGHPCERYLWLTFRWAHKAVFEPRVLRLFDTGKREEARVYEELRGIGVELHTDEGGKQIDCRDESGHFGGSVDGICKGFPESPKTWAVLEIKTHSAKSFADLQKKGVKESKPRHYAQMQVYMGLQKLTRAMYYAVNKDTDDTYTEWLHFNQAAFDALMDRAKRAINATRPPARLSNDPAHFECKWCDQYAVCHQEEIASVNCRTCCHATPDKNGKWKCEEFKNEISGLKQAAACDSHMFIPELVPFGEPVDAGEGWVEYKHKASGRLFKNGAGHYKSRELRLARTSLTADPMIDAIKDTFKGAEIKRVGPVGGRRKKNLAEIPVIDNDDLNDEIPF
jgi:hypothetical protein